MLDKEDLLVDIAERVLRYLQTELHYSAPQITVCCHSVCCRTQLHPRVCHDTDISVRIHLWGRISCKKEVLIVWHMQC